MCVLELTPVLCVMALFMYVLATLSKPYLKKAPTKYILFLLTCRKEGVIHSFVALHSEKLSKKLDPVYYYSQGHAHLPAMA